MKSKDVRQQALSQLLSQLAQLGTFKRSDARALWDGEGAFQSVWTLIMRSKRIARQELPGDIQSRGYRWCVVKDASERSELP